jgi:glycosyltransferase involved in cell wall biosynthesis
MEILYSHRTRSADGQYVHISELTNALAGNGHDVVLSGPDGIMRYDEAPARPMDAQQSGGPGLSALVPKSLYELAEMLYSIPAYSRLRRAFATSKADVIYERYNLFFLAGLWLKQKTGKPLLLEVNAPLRTERAEHGGLALPFLARWAEQKVWRGADAVLPVTQVLAQDVIAMGVPEEKVHVIPNGIAATYLEDHDGTGVRARYGLEEKSVLGFTGFVRDWHGVDQVLTYIAERQDPSLHLLLVGDGPHVPALKKQATKLGIENQMTITGVVQREDIPAHVAAFDIALQPRVTAYASPLKLFEYMALGKPVIAPAQANIEEVLNHGENALLFAPDDQASFAAALDTLLSDKEKAAHLGAAARQTILDKEMTWTGNAKKVAAIAARLTGEAD